MKTYFLAAVFIAAIAWVAVALIHAGHPWIGLILSAGMLGGISIKSD